MINNGLKIPFAWYDDINKQANRKTACKGDCCYKLITPTDRLLPFQFRGTNIQKNTPIASWEIFRSDGTLFIDLTSNVNLLEKYKTTDGWGYLQYKGNSAIPALVFDCGFFYSKIETDGVEYYSENFFIPLSYNQNNYMVIEFWDSCDVGNILFQKGWHGKIMLESEIEKSTHEIYEEGVENGVKDFFPTFQKYIQNLRFDEFCPEFVVQALVALQMYKEVKITTKGGLSEGKVFGIKSAVTWEENGCNAVVEIKMQQEDELYRTSCCNNLKLIP